jgi:hypothetical protein
VVYPFIRELNVTVRKVSQRATPGLDYHFILDYMKLARVLLACLLVRSVIAAPDDQTAGAPSPRFEAARTLRWNPQVGIADSTLADGKLTHVEIFAATYCCDAQPCTPGVCASSPVSGFIGRLTEAYSGASRTDYLLLRFTDADGRECKDGEDESGTACFTATGTARAPNPILNFFAGIFKGMGQAIYGFANLNGELDMTQEGQQMQQALRPINSAQQRGNIVATAGTILLVPCIALIWLTMREATVPSRTPVAIAKIPSSLPCNSA